MRDDGLAALEMAEIAASSDALPRRGERALAVLRRVVPFDSARLALLPSGSSGSRSCRTRVICTGSRRGSSRCWC